jgi:hypothetical protein
MPRSGNRGMVETWGFDSPDGKRVSKAMREVRVLGGIPCLQTEFRTDSKKLPPNKRLKLPARVVCGRIAFVIIPAWRRSLSAIR